MGISSIEQSLAIKGWMAEQELLWLSEVALSVPKDALVVEIGSWEGRSSSAIYLSGGKNKTIISIDTWKGSPDEELHKIAQTEDIFKLYIDNMNNIGISPQDFVRFQYGHYGVEFEWTGYSKIENGIFYLKSDSVEASKYLADNSIDWLFIDGWHTGLKYDLDAYMPKMKKDGLLSGHDYFCFYNEIQQEIHKRFYIHGVIGNIWYKFMNVDNPPSWYKR